MNLADQESGTLDLKVDRPFSVSSPTSDTVVLVDLDICDANPCGHMTAILGNLWPRTNLGEAERMKRSLSSKLKPCRPTISCTSLSFHHMSSDLVQLS
jgi:hypothetical protein